RDEATKKLESGLAAVMPGEPETSSLIARIMSADEDERMPPADSKKVLSAAQKEILKRWIQEGAGYAQHWSFVAPQKAPLPVVSGSGWIKNEIDQFVLARLKAEKLAPSPAADRQMLIRRLSLDLTGLPPSSEEA